MCLSADSSAAYRGADASADSGAAYNYRGVLPMREQFYRHFEVLLMSIEL